MAVTVAFSGPLDQRLREACGEDERATPRRLLAQAVDHALERAFAAAAAACGLRVELALVDARAGHPTPRLALDRPSIDPRRSAPPGGAALTATIRTADERVLGPLSDRHFGTDLAPASPAGDARADARVAIERFHAPLAARLRPAG